MTDTAAPTPNRALADAIEKSGLRKGFIAKQLGVHQSLLSHWLRGAHDPSQVQREKLALILRRDPDEFLRHESEGSEIPDAPRADHGNELPERAGRAA